MDTLTASRYTKRFCSRPRASTTSVHTMRKTSAFLMFPHFLVRRKMASPSMASSPPVDRYAHGMATDRPPSLVKSGSTSTMVARTLPAPNRNCTPPASVSKTWGRASLTAMATTARRRWR